MIEIRECAWGDFEPVLELLRQLWPGRELDREALADVFRHNLGLASQHYLCAVSGGEVVGFCSLSVRKSLWGQGFLGYLDEMVVDEKRRGEGIGGRLLERALELAKEDGCRRVELDSAFHREDAHRFYESHGFEGVCQLFGREI
ncbi:MAG: GNAT family N-acetyltransferase [Actinobacteria bacterium]|jgi:GNAT superfamily N-acetyltransferase|nr:MAG: GNAT family N-acetyltransferase [Actinomycetota bacterium]